MDNANVLKMAVSISSLSCASDQSDVKEIFPIRPSCVNFALESPLGMQYVDAEDKGKHTASLVQCLQALFFLTKRECVV